jgi:hypothetical protein
MTAALLPEVPYDRTSVRPAWADLPLALREAIESRLGSVVWTRPTGTGFTSGFVASLGTANGEAHFVKVAEPSTLFADGYAAEARFSAALPRAIPAPRLRWSEELAGHIVLCFDAIDGARTPGLPWEPAELRATLDALAQAGAVLADPTAELLAANPYPWAEVLDGPLSMGRSGLVMHERAAELTALETRFAELTAGATTLSHCDFRLDNVAIDREGRAWLCDWSFLGFGPTWLDLLTLLLSVEASGSESIGDPDEHFFAHPLGAGVTDELLDAGLGAMAGYYVYSGGLDEIPTSPALRGHQRYYARLTLRWLGRRRRWG